MLVRIRFHSGPTVTRVRRKNRHVALAVASLLTPAMLAALALGFWRLAADLGLAAPFAIQNGLFSHWQVWLAVGALLQFTASMLNRYGEPRSSLQNSEDASREILLDSGFMARGAVPSPITLADEPR